MLNPRVIELPFFQGSADHQAKSRQKWLLEEIGEEEFHSLTPLEYRLFVLTTKPKQNSE